MPLSEQEELEMLELEKEKSLSSGAVDPYGRPISRAEVIRNEYPSETFGRYAEPIAAIAGGLMSRVPLVGTAAAALGAAGAEAARQGIQHYGNEPIAPGTSEEAAGRVVRAMGRGAGGELLGRGMFAGAAKLVPSKPVVAQGIRAMTGVPERATMRALNDPKILTGPGKKEAGEAYGKAFEEMGITTGEEGVRQTFGKSIIPKEKLYDLYDDLIPSIKSGDASLQTSFSLRKAMSDEINNIPMSERETLRRLSKRINALDDYIESKVPEWGGLRKGYADAMAAEEFASWLPRNKNLSPNVLRTTAALATTIKGAAEGSPIAAIALPAVSPRMYGYGIRTGAAVAPAIKGTSLFGSKVVGQTISGLMLPSSTEELMRKHYEAQRAQK